jgi:hypothetical protein
MIKFYRKKDCPKCTGIQEALEELVLAHKVIVVEGKGELKGTFPEGTRLPVMDDEGKLYQGIDAIMAHLEELTEFKEQWYKFQSDACYCDEDE